jgi:hypothetical protein
MKAHNKVTEPSDEANGCPRAWSWLRGLEIESVTSNLHRQVRFTNGQLLTIRTANYQEQRQVV